MNTLINEVNKEYLFWRPHQDEEYPVDSIPVSYEIDNAKYHSSTEAVPTSTPVPVNCTDVVSNEDTSSNLTVVTVVTAAAAAATDDDDAVVPIASCDGVTDDGTTNNDDDADFNSSCCSLKSRKFDKYISISSTGSWL